MSTNVQSILAALTPEKMADEISILWDTYKTARASWEAEVLEIRNYKYATSTNTTEVGDNHFANSTTIPKLSQIAMNLQANYKAHLFSNPKWAQFEAFDKAASDKDARKLVEAYVRTKIKRKDYEGVFSKLLVDWIDTGVCFSQQQYVTETYVDGLGHTKMLYQGCVLERISPNDIVFDVTATSFERAAKVIRKIYTMGDIRREIDENPDTPFTHEILEEMRTTRNNIRNGGAISVRGVDWKQETLTKAGLGSLMTYMKGDIVEVLEFYGDFYSVETGEYLKNHKIIVLDKRKVIFSQPIVSRNGSQHIYMSGWEDRADTLMAMSPLARLCGMQYKLDKLENQRADAFDEIIHPIVVETGDVEFQGVRGEPGGRYTTDEKGSVQLLRPDTTVLNADFQMQNSMAIMEEMAGSPRNASGFRTPGEKTKFEVQFLEQGGNRIFREKTHKFEKEMVEMVLNDMVEMAMDNLGETDLVSTEGTGEFRVEEFLAVSKEDLNISGKLHARGSKLFAEKANALQNLLGVMASPAFKLINPHTSRIKLTQAIEELADLEGMNIFVPNIGVQEDAETAQLANQTQQSTAEIDQVNAEEPIDADIEDT